MKNLILAILFVWSNLLIAQSFNEEQSYGPNYGYPGSSSKSKPTVYLHSHLAFRMSDTDVNQLRFELMGAVKGVLNNAFVASCFRDKRGDGRWRDRWRNRVRNCQKGHLPRMINLFQGTNSPYVADLKKAAAGIVLKYIGTRQLKIEEPQLESIKDFNINHILPLLIDGPPKFHLTLDMTVKANVYSQVSPIYDDMWDWIVDANFGRPHNWRRLKNALFGLLKPIVVAGVITYVETMKGQYMESMKAQLMTSIDQLKLKLPARMRGYMAIHLRNINLDLASSNPHTVIGLYMAINSPVSASISMKFFLHPGGSI